MTQLIELGSHTPGTLLQITNGTPRAVQYDIGFGRAGAVSLTLIPGGRFGLTVGEWAPHIEMNDAAPPGITVVPPHQA